jgi:hypothetical protein
MQQVSVEQETKKAFSNFINFLPFFLKPFDESLKAVAIMGPIVVTATGVKTLTADMLFRVFTACPGDPHTLILDVRPKNEYAKKHILLSYCVRVSANGKALLVGLCIQL